RTIHVDTTFKFQVISYTPFYLGNLPECMKEDLELQTLRVPVLRCIDQRNKIFKPLISAQLTTEQFSQLQNEHTHLSDPENYYYFYLNIRNCEPDTITINYAPHTCPIIEIEYSKISVLLLMQ